MFYDTMSYENIYPNNIWDENKVAHGEAVVNIAHYDAFIITGSRFNISDASKLIWFEPLCKLIRQIAGCELSPVDVSTKRLYGSCYGHHIVAHALGGVVGSNPSGNFILSAEILHFYDTIVIQNHILDYYYKNILCLPKNPIKVICSHGDAVLKLPVKIPCQVLATSQSCLYEMFITGKYANILCMQGHPEFDYEYCIKDRILPSVLNLTKRITEDEAEKSVISFMNFSRSSGPNQLSLFIAHFLNQ